MMGIKQIAAARSPGKGYATLIRTGKGTYVITHGNRIRFDSAEKIVSELNRLATRRSDTLDSVYIHINRDNSVALAIEAEPDVWPEDEAEEDFTSIETKKKQ
jgi:hypothetical protein